MTIVPAAGGDKTVIGALAFAPITRRIAASPAGRPSPCAWRLCRPQRRELAVGPIMPGRFDTNDRKGPPAPVKQQT